MGVSGCGKTTIGTLLSKELNIPFYDGDDFHPEVNVKKMEAGNALNDRDRHDWLVRLNELAIEHPDGAIIACSSLKEAYRSILCNNIENRVVWIHLKGTFKEISERMSKRENHYMPSSLLQSQFDVLEAPDNGITVDITKPPDQMIEGILNQL
ncbi:MAG: gluconate kinase [Flavobacteriaceae bacterium]|nr:MAG: gluconate kinase [Flavobacteriaceae bacterium]